MPERHELVIARIVAYGQRSAPSRHFTTSVPAAFQMIGERRKFLPCRRSIKTTDPHVDRMNGATAQQRNNFVPEFLQIQTLLHKLGMILRHVDCIRITEKIRRMKHKDVEGVA